MCHFEVTGKPHAVTSNPTKSGQRTCTISVLSRLTRTQRHIHIRPYSNPAKLEKIAISKKSRGFRGLAGLILNETLSMIYFLWSPRSDGQFAVSYVFLSLSVQKLVFSSIFATFPAPQLWGVISRLQNVRSNKGWHIRDQREKLSRIGPKVKKMFQSVSRVPSKPALKL